MINKAKNLLSRGKKLAGEVVQSKDFKHGVQLGVVVAGVAVIAPAVQAAGLPWEGPLSTITNSLQGPTAKMVGAIAIIGTGCALAFGEHGSVVRRLLMIVCGLSVAFFASTFINDVFPSRETTVDPTN